MNDTNSTTSGVDGVQIAGLLIEQRDLYRALSRLTERQRNLITGDDPERLLTLLAERQQLIDKLQAISRRLRPFQANWRQIREGLGDEDGLKIDGLVGEIDSLLGEILKKDEADTALLSARKSEKGQAIGAIQAGRQAGRAYTAGAEQFRQGMDWTQA